MRKYFVVFFISCIVISCSEKYVLTDPETGLAPQALTTTPNSICELIKIKQINGNISFNRLSFQKDTSNKTIALDYFDSITNTIDLKIDFQYIGDTIKIDATSWMLKNHLTNNIVKYFVQEKITDTTWDNVLYEYNYDASGKLSKKSIYYNQIITPDYTTNYIYDGDDLVRSVLLASDGITKVMQTDLQYDATIIIKPWIYLFGDAFENYKMIQGFSFGKKAVNPVKQIITKVFDANNGTVIDTWTTNYNGYVYSADQYVLQVSTTGDNQQGMGLFLGTMRFDYSCK